MYKGIKNNRAFTLVELIVVVGIIGILVGIAQPKFMGYTKKADKAMVQQSAKVLSNASEIYYLENDKWPINKDVYTDSYRVDLDKQERLYQLSDVGVDEYLDSTSKDKDEYGLAISGEIEGRVFHLGKDIETRSKQYGLFDKDAINSERTTDIRFIGEEEIELSIGNDVFGAFEGIYVTNNKSLNLKPNERYILSYDYKKKSGELESFGGHIGLGVAERDTDELYINGELVDKKYYGYDGVFTSDNSRLHSVRYIFTTIGNIKTGPYYGNNGIWIQPNRGSTKEAVVSIYNLKLLRYVDWWLIEIC